MDSVFTELSLIILITTAVSILMKFMKQPLILGYILSGLLVGPSVFNLITSVEIFQTFATLGIALLLFIIGLGMNPKDLMQLGKPVFMVAIGILATVSLTGFIVSYGFGLSTIESILVGLALFFSSTIIIVKILSDKKEQHRLHGQIAIGVILFDDIVATIALLFISSNSSGGLSSVTVSLLFVKGVLALLGLAIVSRYILPKVVKSIASSQELLFLFAITWGFSVASFFSLVGFSIEIGALFAGVMLSETPYAKEISSRLKPLRDFFIVLFFIFLGESMNVQNIVSGLALAALLSAIVIILKPLVTIFILRRLGYSKRVSLKTGVNLSQISEFSIIMILLAVNTGLVSNEVGVVVTLVAIITIAISTYLIIFDDYLYNIVFSRMNLLSDQNNRSSSSSVDDKDVKSYPLILVGYHDGGREFIKAFKDINKEFMVIDYDPAVVENLTKRNIPVLYGDVTDMDLIDEMNLTKTELIISTFTDMEASKQFVMAVRRQSTEAIIINQANNHLEAELLYELGSNYVIVPRRIGTQKLSSFIKEHGYDRATFDRYKMTSIV